MFRWQPLLFRSPADGHPRRSNTVLTIGPTGSGVGTAIAVNPSNPNHVMVAYAAVTNTCPVRPGVIQVIVHESTNGGMTWTQTYSRPTGCGRGCELAILNNGTIGVLYNSFDPSTNKLVAHLVTTTNDFVTVPPTSRWLPKPTPSALSPTNLTSGITSALGRR